LLYIFCKLTKKSDTIQNIVQVLQTDSAHNTVLFSPSNTYYFHETETQEEKTRKNSPPRLKGLKKVINKFSYNLKTNKICHFIGDYHPQAHRRIVPSKTLSTKARKKSLKKVWGIVENFVPLNPK
jgi:hypothetical protein